MVPALNKEAGASSSETPTITRSLELPESPKDLQKQQQQPSDSLQILINGETDAKVEEGPKSLESVWVISIEEKIKQASQNDAAGAWARVCIYRVPQCLAQHGGDEDDNGYIPHTVSLGPYHHGREHLSEMENHKWRSLYHALKRTGQDIKLYLDSVKELEERALACYECPISLTSNEFVQMMVLDGCFILELFRGVAQGFGQLGYSQNDPVFAMRGMMHSIQRDMIMLENQIPLFILDRLLELQRGQSYHKGLLAELALRFLDPLMPTDESFTKKDTNKLETSFGHVTPFDPLSDQGGLHCLDVFRRSLLRKGPIPEPKFGIRRKSNAIREADKRKQQLIHCVRELAEAGVKFEKRKTDRFWDIEFENGVLKMPRLLIHDGSKSLFLNLIAFEQCHLDSRNEITSYVIFLNNLINSPEDVGYLHYRDIIEHWFRSDAEVANLFDRLCKDVVFDVNENYLSGLSEQVNQYYDNKWNTWRASFGHTYFSNPWSLISFVAAVVLLLLTLAQTFYAVYGYYRPH